MIFRWLQSQFVEPLVSWLTDSVLGTWEESFKAVLREGFATLTRLINGVSAWAVSVFFAEGYYDTMRSKTRKASAWQSWWEDRAQSTFAAVLERDGLLVGSPRAAAQSDQSQPALADKHGWPSSLRKTRHKVSLQPSRNSDAASSRRRWYQLWSRTAAGAPGESLMSYSTKNVNASHDRGRSRPRMRRSGSELFERPSGYGIAEGLPRRGLLEDARLGLELAVTVVFEAARTAIRALLLLPQRQAAASSQEAWIPHRAFRELASSTKFHRASRPSPTSRIEDLNVWTAADVILQAGYPLEEHIVTTSTGYILQMHRIPRKGARDVVFFMHGILDTSLGWVSNGVLGSQAFAAWDSGHDVWLGNSRSNPPRAHVSPHKQGAYYWRYTMNELGAEDIAAQVDHIHMVKCGELQSGWVWRHTALEDSAALAEPAPRMRRTVSDTALAERRRVELAAASTAGDGLADKNAGGSTPAPPSHQTRVSLDGARSRPVQQGFSLSVPLHSLGPAEDQPRSTSRSTGSHQQMLRSLSLLPLPRAPQPAEQIADIAQPSDVAAQLLASPSAPLSTPPSAAVAEAAVQNTQRPDVPETDTTCSEHSAGDSAGSVRWQALADALRCQQTGANDDEADMQASTISACRSGSVPSSGEADVEPVWFDASDSSFSTGSNTSFSDRGSSTGVDYAGTPSRQSAGLEPEGRQRHLATLEPVAVQACATEGQPASCGPPLAALPTPEPPSQSGTERGMPRYTWMPRGQQRGLSEPYRLRAVGHSLGAASLLIYAVVSRMKGQPHRFRRMVLLTPAGFHMKHPKVLIPFIIVVPWLVRFLDWLKPGIGSPAYLPSSLVRYIAFKLSLDMDHIPGLNELTRAGISLMLSGDSSQWDRALQMPHYNTYSMPAVSFHTGDHFMQLMRTGRFRLYDYGSPEDNKAHYGTSKPPDIAQHYHLLQDLPIDLVAGRQDGIIPPEDVLLHYKAMEQAGVQVTYKEFNVGHLDVTFAVKDDIRHYVLSRLQPRKWLNWRNRG